MRTISIQHTLWSYLQCIVLLFQRRDELQRPQVSRVVAQRALAAHAHVAIDATDGIGRAVDAKYVTTEAAVVTTQCHRESCQR